MQFPFRPWSRRASRLAVRASLPLLMVSGAAVTADRAVPVGSFVVQLRSDTAELAAETVSRGVAARPRYQFYRAIRGFAADLTEAQLRVLRQDGRVLRIMRDLPVRVPRNPDAVSNHAAAAAARGPRRSTQVIPTGVQRIGGLSSPTAEIDGVDQVIDVDVAVLDTGIDPRHPDLRVAGGFTVFRDRRLTDPHGHGTHVAGIIGALDNNLGVVGVAPGVRLWSVRVLPRSGHGKWSDVIKGLDWVATQGDELEVANLSLGGEVDEAGPIRDAVQACVDAGVTVVVAAGNDAQPIEGNPPLSYPIVPAVFDGIITVSALADRNGSPSTDPALFRVRRGYIEEDESYANFSNYGEGIDLIAPGVAIRSTFKGRRYATYSGTSQAAPHVSGAAALYLATHPTATPAEVRQALRSAGSAFAPSDDPDGILEPAVRVTGF